MAITEKQRIARKKWLGSSDVSTILGLNPFATAFDCWCDKTGRVTDFEGNADCDRGNDLEPAILNWAERQLGVPLVRDVFVADKLGTILCANLDAEAMELDAIIEAKSSVNADEWGEPDSDQVPERVIVQTTVAMFCAGRRVAYVPVLTPGFKKFDFRMYRINLNADLAHAIVERAEAFWKNHVLADVPPEGSFGSIEVLKRMKRTPEKIVELPDSVVERWADVREQRLAREKEEEAALAEMLTALGDAEAGTFSGGVVSYMETIQNRKAQPARTVTFRTARLKRDKAAMRLAGVA